jgi:hypothetical protein
MLEHFLVSIASCVLNPRFLFLFHCSITTTTTTTAVYWLKQVIAVLTGLICAIVPFNGAIGFSLFVIHMVLFSHIFAFNYLKVDDNVVGGSMPVWTEGAFTALAFFLLVWITLYTILHDPELLSH